MSENNEVSIFDQELKVEELVRSNKRRSAVRIVGEKGTDMLAKAVKEIQQEK